MTAKEYLRGYYDLTKQIEILDGEIADLTAEIENTGGNLDGMPKGSEIADKTGSLASRIADITTEVMDMRTKAINKRHEILQNICQMKRGEYKMLLHQRYVQFKRFEEIAVEMNYSYNRVRHMHGEALVEFTKVSTF